MPGLSGAPEAAHRGWPCQCSPCRTRRLEALDGNGRGGVLSGGSGRVRRGGAVCVRPFLRLQTRRWWMPPRRAWPSWCAFAHPHPTRASRKGCGGWSLQGPWAGRQVVARSAMPCPFLRAQAQPAGGGARHAGADVRGPTQICASSPSTWRADLPVSLLTTRRDRRDPLVAFVAGRQNESMEVAQQRSRLSPVGVGRRGTGAAADLDLQPSLSRLRRLGNRPCGPVPGVRWPPAWLADRSPCGRPPPAARRPDGCLRSAGLPRITPEIRVPSPEGHAEGLGEFRVTYGPRRRSSPGSPSRSGWSCSITLRARDTGMAETDAEEPPVRSGD